MQTRGRLIGGGGELAIPRGLWMDERWSTRMMVHQVHVPLGVTDGNISIKVQGVAGKGQKKCTSPGAVACLRGRPKMCLHQR